MCEFETTSFCELRTKEVVNVLDGRRLGRIIDIVFDPRCNGEVKGIVVPFVKRFFLFRDKEVFVPWGCIRKIGEDVILIELTLEEGGGGHHHGGRRRRRHYDAFEDGRFSNKGGGEDERRGKEGGARVHTLQRTKDNDTKQAQQADELLEEQEDTPYKKPQFELNKKPSSKKKQIKSPYTLDNRCDGKCEKCMLFDCAHRWKEKP